MLAGVHENFIHVRRGEGAAYRSRFDELGARANNCKDTGLIQAEDVLMDKRLLI
jgi:hypothetical protein